MSIFKHKKKKKSSEFDLVIDNKLLKDESLFEEETVDSIPTNEEPSLKTKEELISEVEATFKKIESKNELVIKENITNKILSRVGLRDLDFNMQVVAMDKHIDRLKKECFNLSRIVENLKIGLNMDVYDLTNLLKQLTDLQAFQTGILNQFSEMRNATYGQLKMSTITVTMNKTVEELETLYNNISKELKDFKSFEEASEYIFYNSGNFLDDLLNKFIKYIKGTKNKEYIEKYDKAYFLGSDVAISLEIKEWVDLYNKLKFVSRQIGSYDKKAYLKVLELIQEFEAKYAILMMRTESKRD